MNEFALHPEVLDFVERKLAFYLTKRSLLVPTLLLAQEYHGGYVSPELIKSIAKLLEVPEQEVYSTASFYSLINKERVGRHVIMACHNISCYLRGGDSLIAKLEKLLGIKVGETTADGRFTLFTVECLAACGGAPAMMIDKEYFENVSEDALEEILAKFK